MIIPIRITFSGVIKTTIDVDPEDDEAYADAVAIAWALVPDDEISEAASADDVEEIAWALVPDDEISEAASADDVEEISEG